MSIRNTSQNMAQFGGASWGSGGGSPLAVRNPGTPPLFSDMEQVGTKSGIACVLHDATSAALRLITHQLIGAEQSHAYTWRSAIDSVEPCLSPTPPPPWFLSRTAISTLWRHTVQGLYLLHMYPRSCTSVSALLLLVPQFVRGTGRDS